MKSFRIFLQETSFEGDTPNQDELRRYASFYKDQWVPGEPGYVDPSKATWSLEPAYPINQIVDLTRSNAEYLVQDDQERTRERGGVAFPANWWTEPQHYTDCVVLVDKKGKGYIWDGWHRAAYAKLAGLTTIPAMVGRKSPVNEDFVPAWKRMNRFGSFMNSGFILPNGKVVEGSNHYELARSLGYRYAIDPIYDGAVRLTSYLNQNDEKEAGFELLNQIKPIRLLIRYLRDNRLGPTHIDLNKVENDQMEIVIAKSFKNSGEALRWLLEISRPKSSITESPRSGIELCPEDPDDFDYLEKRDGYFYHVTPRRNIKNILRFGLFPNRRPSMADGYYRDYSKGKIFFCERDGVSYWVEVVQRHLENQNDDMMAPKLAVVRFPKSIVKDFDKDVTGEQDSRRPAYYTTKPIKVAIKENKEHLIEGRYVYHGTSSKFLDSIKRSGLQINNRKDTMGGTDRERFVYVTNDPAIAGEEALNTVEGDIDGAPGVGGEPVILKIDRFHPGFRSSGPWRKDEGYHSSEYDDVGVHRLHSFASRKAIPPGAIVSVHKLRFNGGRYAELGDEFTEGRRRRTT